MTRLVRHVFVVLLTALATLVVVAPAEAGVPQSSVAVTKNYVKNWVFRSTPLSACMFVEIAGSITGTHRYAYYASDGGWDPNHYVWSGIKMANPRVTMKTGSLTSTGCDFSRPVTFSKATLRQDWYDGGCKLSVGISAGFPWSVSASPTYSCGTYNVGRRATSYGAASSFAQYNSGYPVYYNGEKLAGAADALPFRGNVLVTGYRTVGGVARSDSFSTNSAVAFLSR